VETRNLLLSGEDIRLEPLDYRHVAGLVAASAADPSLYLWSPVPQGTSAATAYVETAIAWRDAGSAVPFAIVRLQDAAVIGSTRFWNIERWLWPQGHPRRSFALDACEIGYTWFTGSAIRTKANTEAKMLMLTHAFETGRYSASACIRTRATSVRGRQLNALVLSLNDFFVPIEWRQTLRRATRFATRSSQQSGPA
jgi:RimJ/RimL family protein N-acetyltransferase